MNKNIKVLFLVALVFFGICMVTENVFAGRFNYVLLEKIPGFETVVDAGNFNIYIANLYKFAVWTVGIAATMMLGIGGFMYFTSAGNTSHLEKAKTVIKDSIIGVIVTLTAYLLLFVINPDLIGGNISSSQSASVQNNNSSASYSVPVDPFWPPDPTLGTLPAGSMTHLEATTAFIAAGGTVTSPNPNCLAIYDAGGCVSLDGIPKSVVDGLVKAGELGFPLVITGGTEWWTHFTSSAGCPSPVTADDLPLLDECTGLHAPGKPGVDIQIPAAADCLASSPPYDCTNACPPIPAWCPSVQEKIIAAVMDATGASTVQCARGGTEPVSCLGAVDRLHIGF